MLALPQTGNKTKIKAVSDDFVLVLIHFYFWLQQPHWARGADSVVENS